jgi:hypothetical protein
MSKIYNNNLTYSFNNLTEEKIKLEYDLNQRSDLTHKQLNDLRHELDDVQIILNDK